MAELTESLKAEAYGKIKAGVKLVELVTELGIPYPKLLKLRRELKLAEEDGTIAELVDVQAVVVHEIAETVKNDLVELVDSPKEVQVIGANVAEAVKNIEGLQLLNAQVQTTAMKLTNRISDLAGDDKTDARTICLLTDALTKLQIAFFNKQTGAQVNILQQNNTDGPLGEFKALCAD